MSSFFEHQRTSYRKNYLRNLIFLASADGHLDEIEKYVITKIGVKHGLKEWQIKDILEDESKHELYLPESQTNRIGLLYDLMQVLYADGEVSEKEIDFVASIVAKFNMEPALVDHMLAMFKYSTPSAEEWHELFVRVADGRAYKQAAA